MSNERIWRSLLFIPANSWRMLNKAAVEQEDGVVIDLEDACPVGERETGRIFARDIVPTLKKYGVDVLVRVNSLETGVTEEDLAIVVTEGLDGIMLPKSESAEDIRKLDDYLTKVEKEKGISREVAILPLIESPKGILNAHEIGSASKRVAGLAFGAGDYMSSLGEGFTIAKLTPDEYFPILSYPRSVISIVATTLGVLPIDTPYFGLLIDVEGLEQETSRAKLMGFKGKLLTHPRHVGPVNKVFSPSEEDVEYGRKVVEAYEEAAAGGRGTAVLDGKMIDYAMHKMGKDLLAKADAIRKKAELKAKVMPYV
ncbi:MAG: CoA ester lyase [Desulfobacterales bacterium]|nr:CoA ester lyase [Desulfobacterales bacterium]